MTRETNNVPGTWPEISDRARVPIATGNGARVAVVVARAGPKAVTAAPEKGRENRGGAGDRVVNFAGDDHRISAALR